MLGFALVLIALIIVVSKSVVSVPPGFEFVVERKGRFSRVLKPGFHLSLIPFVDGIARRYSTQLRVLTIPTLTEPNQEALPLKVDSEVSYQVTDSEKVYQGLNDHEQELAAFCHTAIKTALQEYTLDELMLGRGVFEEVVKRRLDDKLRRLGIRILSFSARTIVPPEEVIRALEVQAKRERAQREAME